MDGQRRVGKSMKQQRRNSSVGFMDFGNTLRARFLARASAVLVLGLTIMHAVSQGGYLDYQGSPWLKIPGKLSSVVGMAADDIRITGLVHQDPEMVLTALGLKPGGSLVGFKISIRHYIIIIIIIKYF